MIQKINTYSDHFSIESSTGLAFYAIVVEWGIDRFMQALVTKNAHLSIFELLGKIIFGFFYFRLNMFVLVLA